MGRLTSPIRSTLPAAILAASFAFTLASPALAETAQAQVHPVSYSDLDISSPDGARILLGRLNDAARAVCGPEPVRSPLLPRAVTHHDQCVTDTVDAAVTSLDAPLVLALHTNTNTNPSGMAVLAAR